MIETRDLTKVYRMGEEEVRALDGVSVRIEAGTKVAILGPSGSGKSTLMHLIGGLDTPTSGLIVVDGEELARLSEVELARYRNEKIGFVFQSFHLQPHLSAAENVALPLKIRGVPRRERDEIAAARLAEVGLSDRVGHRPTELSGGQRQRVCVARALAGGPKLLIADEPTGNLDQRSGGEIIDLFLRLNEQKGLTIVVVTHNAEIAERMTRQLIIRDGRILEDRERSAEPATAQAATAEATPPAAEEA